MKSSVLRVAAMCLCLVLMFSYITACSKKNEVQNDNMDDAQKTVTASEEKKDVTLNVWSYPYLANEKLDDSLQNMVKEYQAKNSNMKINLEVLDYQGGPDKVGIAVSSNSTPDILVDSTNRVFDYVNMGVVLPLNDMKDQLLKDAGKSIAEASCMNEEMWIYPAGLSLTAMIVNVDLFEQAGVKDLLPLNKEDRTWTTDEFYEAMQAISKLKGVYGLGLFAKNQSSDALFQGFLCGFGAKIYNEDLTKIALNSPEGIEALEFVKKMLNEGLLYPGPESLADEEISNIWAEGKVAACLAGTWEPSNMRERYKNKELEKVFDYEYVAMPTKGGTEPTHIGFMQGGCIFKSIGSDETKIQVAKDFIVFCFKDNAQFVDALGLSSPFIKDSSNEDLKSLSRFLKFVKSPGFGAKGFAEVRAKFYPEMQALFVGAKTAEQALNDFAKYANEVLDKYNK
jgi:multiple sugar transport system substrate-binding protein